MILALAGQFKQLSHEPEKFRWLNGIRTHVLAEVMGFFSNPVFRQNTDSLSTDPLLIPYKINGKMKIKP